MKIRIATLSSNGQEISVSPLAVVGAVGAPAIVGALVAGLTLWFVDFPNAAADREARQAAFRLELLQTALAVDSVEARGQSLDLLLSTGLLDHSSGFLRELVGDTNRIPLA